MLTSVSAVQSAVRINTYDLDLNTCELLSGRERSHLAQTDGNAFLFFSQRLEHARWTSAVGPCLDDFRLQHSQVLLSLALTSLKSTVARQQQQCHLKTPPFKPPGSKLHQVHDRVLVLLLAPFGSQRSTGKLVEKVQR